MGGTRGSAGESRGETLRGPDTSRDQQLDHIDEEGDQRVKYLQRAMLAQQAFHAWGFDVAPPTVSDPARCHREDCGYMDMDHILLFLQSLGR